MVYKFILKNCCNEKKRSCGRVSPSFFWALLVATEGLFGEI